MENPDLHPALRYIQSARDQGQLEDYDAALKYYKEARELVQEEVDNCTEINALTVWNAMLRELRDEEDSVLKIKRALDSVVNKLDDQRAVPPKPNADDDDEAVEAPQWSHESRSPVKELKPPERRKVLNRGQPAKRGPAANRASPGVGMGAQPPAGVAGRKVQPRPRVMVDGPGVKPARPKQAGIKVSAPSSKKGKKESKPAKPDPLDPATNPLVQQIIDMGILVREPNVSWDSIAGLASVKRLLRQNLVILPMRPDIAKGLLAPWKSVLFYGPPGTGKTFLAKAVATECKRTFFNITSATITSRFLGESEKLVGHLFALAEQMAPSTIFFDEIDSVASQRGSGNEHESSRRMKAELLTKLEGIDGASDNSSVFVLAATNFPWDLDEALLRRFQKRIFIPLPDEEGRLTILKMCISDNTAEDFDWDRWAKALEGYSCADITNLCRDAVQTVFDRKTSLLDTQEWLSMPAEDAQVLLTNSDFASAITKRRSSVDPASLAKYDEWRRLKGAE